MARFRWAWMAAPCGPHQQGGFAVIAGKSVVAFRREQEGEVPSAKCFGFVPTYDEKPHQRFWELLKSQGMQENQQVVFMSVAAKMSAEYKNICNPTANIGSTGFPSPCG